MHQNLLDFSLMQQISHFLIVYRHSVKDPQSTAGNTATHNPITCATSLMEQEFSLFRLKILIHVQASMILSAFSFVSFTVISIELNAKN